MEARHRRHSETPVAGLGDGRWGVTDVRRVPLPGIGVLHSFVTENGGKVGVVDHRSGRSELVTFVDAEDESDARVSLGLNEDEAHTLAELLGGTQITTSLAALDALPGLSIDWLVIENDDYVSDKPLGSPAERGLVGLAVVAVVRDGSAYPAPAPDLVIRPGDTLVVAGSADKAAKALTYFRTGQRAAAHIPDTADGG